MRVLKDGETDRTARMHEEDESVRGLYQWVSEGFELIAEYLEEAASEFPNGMTYQDAYQFLESK